MTKTNPKYLKFPFSNRRDLSIKVVSSKGEFLSKLEFEGQIFISNKLGLGIQNSSCINFDSISIGNDTILYCPFDYVLVYKNLFLKKSYKLFNSFDVIVFKVGTVKCYI